MASTYLSRTFGTPTNASKFTISVWVKRSGLGGNWKTILSSYVSNTRYTNFSFNGSDQFAWHILDTSEVSKLYSNAKYRDVNGWYHLVFNWDSTQATANDRTKLWVNGEQITSWNTQTNSAQNTNYEMNTAVTHYIGAEKGNTGGSLGNYFDGSMSHFNFIDGTAYDASYFGETDATTGEWKIKTSPSVTYGNNGFFILKDGNSVTDQSGNGNNWTVSGGTLSNTEDNPSNVFCTMNVLDNQIANSTFSQGNNTIQTNNSNYTWNTGTLGMTSGKFYWEIKYSANSNASYYNLYGIADRPTDGSTDTLGRQTDCSNYAYYSDTGQKYEKNVLSAYGDTWAVGDIIGVAVDLDNNKLYFSKNGVWQNSGDPTSGATGTGAISIDAISSTTTGVYFPASGDYGSTQDATNQHNFGNGYFGTTAVSSAGTNASGLGIFEYDVPSGYTALCTKGLNL